MDQDIPQPTAPAAPVLLGYFYSPRRLFADYFWFVEKTFLGWFLILRAWPVGLLIPGPGGIPIFLVGFALVPFPGKRPLPARALRGKVLDLTARRYTWIAFI